MLSSDLSRPSFWLLAAVLVAVPSPNVEGGVKVSGTFNRTFPRDNCGQIQFNCTCATSATTAGVRKVEVEVRRLDETIVGRGATDSFGAFSVATDLVPGSAFKVILWAKALEGTIANNINGQTLGIEYFFPGASGVDRNIGVVTIDAGVDASAPKVRAALHVLDRVKEGYAYAVNRGVEPRAVLVYLGGGDTWYKHVGNRIDIQDGEEWHDAIYHEYGHFLYDALREYRGSAGLSAHSFCTVANDPAGAFGEGWANYIIHAITLHRFFWGRYCDIEPDGCASTKSASNEGDIAAVLWDLNDPANEWFDGVAGQDRRLFDVMDSFDASTPSLLAFMLAFNAAQAYVIQCHYTGTHCDVAPPSIAITKPTPAGTYTTTTPSVVVGGSASDNVAVASVRWHTNRGGGATMPGATVWETGSITLAPGPTRITVRANDADGNYADATLDVTYVAPSCRLQVLEPNGGEVLRRGQQYLIRWSGIAACSNFQDLGLIRSDGTRVEIAALASGGTYAWTVPANVATGSEYRILVFDSSNLVGDLSDGPFTIEAPAPPTAETRQASSVGLDRASLHAAVNPHGSATVGRFRVDFAGSTQHTGWQDLGHGEGFNDLSSEVTGIPCGTSVSYEPIAQNAGGTAYGLPGTFSTLACPILSVEVGGQGRVASVPSGIDCPSSCSKMYATNSSVRLLPVSATGWTFLRWEGACTGSSQCEVSMTEGRHVTAVFSLVDASLATSVAISSSANPAARGQTSIFTAAVTPADATGTVAFYDDGVPLGTAQALSREGAANTTAMLGSGTHVITASYGGDRRYLPSVSAPLEQVIVPVPEPVREPGPLDGAAGVGIPVTLSWTSAAEAEQYRVFFGDSTPPAFAGDTKATSFSVNAAAATTYFWFVEAMNDFGVSPGPMWSFSTAAAVVCRTPEAPVLTTVGAPLSGARYSIRLSEVAHASSFVLEEARKVDFSRATSFAVSPSGLRVNFTHDVNVDTAFYYRARAENRMAACNVVGPYSATQKVVVKRVAEASFRLVVDRVPSQGGVVTIAPDVVSYSSGTLVTLTAVPAAGFQFVEWTGGATGTAATIMVKMDRDRIVSALFKAVTHEPPRRRAATHPASPYGDFRTFGRLSQPRWAHAAVVLNDGRVFVAGGFWGEGKITNTTDIIDPGKRTVAAGPEMRLARAFHSATLLQDGRVLLVGGMSEDRRGEAEIYDPNTNEFQGTGSPVFPRTLHTATLLPDGSVLIVGGFAPFDAVVSKETASAELYDPSAGTFTPVGEMAVPRYDHVAIALREGGVFIIGGTNCLLPNVAEVYDPATHGFKVINSPILARPFPSAARLIDGKVLIVGYACGEGSDTRAEVFDPITGGFTLVGPMRRPRWHPHAVTLTGGVVAVIGGLGYPTDFSDAEVFYPEMASFGAAYGRAYEGCSNRAVALPVSTNQVLITGGWQGIPVDYVVRYVGGPGPDPPNLPSPPP